MLKSVTTAVLCLRKKVLAYAASIWYPWTSKSVLQKLQHGGCFSTSMCADVLSCQVSQSVTTSAKHV